MVNQKCYPFVDSTYTASTCANIGGYFSTTDIQGQPGLFCYYLLFNCTFHAVNGQCYRLKSAMDHQTDCDRIGGYYRHRYCYYDCPNTMHFMNNRCYSNRSAKYTQNDCKAVGGFSVSYTHLTLPTNREV